MKARGKWMADIPRPKSSTKTTKSTTTPPSSLQRDQSNNNLTLPTSALIVQIYIPWVHVFHALVLVLVNGTVKLRPYIAEQNPETSRLIDDDPYRSQYGSNNRHPQRAAYQPDPESLRREREALEGICHSMSDEVIDVFTVLSSSNEGNLRRPKLPIPMACVTKNTQDEEAPEAIEFKTIRRGRLGPIASPLNRDELGKWQTIAEVMVD